MNSIIKKSQVRLSGQELGDLAQLSGSPGHGHDGARSLRVVEVGGVPSGIEVTCSCGDTFMIELTYEEDQR